MDMATPSCGLWLWCWVFFLLKSLGNDGGSMFGHSGGLVLGCACVVGCHLICGAGLVVLWVAI